jgi:AcrR family transcriptional regulator
MCVLARGLPDSDANVTNSGTDIKPSAPGRPRQFTDDNVFHATNRVLGRHGASGLTLAAVARELGCTGQALNVRFGSRSDLLIAYTDWAAARQMRRFDEVRAAHDSPLQALRARFMLPIEGREDELADGGAQRQMLTLFAESIGDPRLSERWAASGTGFRAAMTDLIREAIARGELIKTDPDQLSMTLLAAMIGIAVIWEPAYETPLVDTVSNLVDHILLPYLPKGGE